VPKPDWGAKRACDDCGARFYDLNRSPVQCPKCGATVKIAAKVKARRSSPPAAKKPVEKIVAANENPGPEADDPELAEGLEADGANEVDDDDDDDDDLIEDTSDLGGGDDVSEVIEHIDRGVEDKA